MSDKSNVFELLRHALNGEMHNMETTVCDWRMMYAFAGRQSLLGVLFAAVKQAADVPEDVRLQWAAEAEAIRGLNEQLYQESVRLTRLFGEQGRRTAILKGQANARLYPDKFVRQPGDIDLWVEGGRESVVKMLDEMGMMPKAELSASYHHVHLPANERGVTVEVHFRPSSGNFNPLTNRRLQRWLEKEILTSTKVDEGFYVPSVRFALVMQLAHIQRHFLAGGIGLRHVCDYYWLLNEASADDLLQVEKLLKKFGLRHIAGALMWVIGEVLHLDTSKMIGGPDSYRGEWMLREIMAGGNFGWYVKRQRHGILRRVLEGRWRHLRLMPFNFWEILWLELRFWKAVISTLPKRIRYRTLSLRDIPR